MAELKRTAAGGDAINLLGVVLAAADEGEGKVPYTWGLVEHVVEGLQVPDGVVAKV